MALIKEMPPLDESIKCHMCNEKPPVAFWSRYDNEGNYDIHGFTVCETCGLEELPKLIADVVVAVNLEEYSYWSFFHKASKKKLSKVTRLIKSTYDSLTRIGSKEDARDRFYTGFLENYHDPDRISYVNSDDFFKR